MKGKVYKSYLRSAILYRRNVVFEKNEVAILRKAKRSMVRATCGVKLVDKKNKEELMDMLGLKEANDKLARVNDERWYGHLL